MLLELLSLAAPLGGQDFMIPAPGGYVSLGKIILMLALVFPWLYIMPWVHKDARFVRSSQTLWCLITLGGGALGLLLWLLIPMYIVGLLVFVVFATATLLSYVAYRNGRVEDHQRVLTGEHLSGLFSRGKSSKPRQEQVVSRLKVYRADKAVILQPPPDAPQADVHGYNLMQNFIYELAYRRASEADVSPTGPNARVRLVIDGVAVDMAPLPLADSEAMIQCIKPHAGMNADDRRRPQQGRLSIDTPTGPCDVLIATTGTTGGQRMQFRLLNESVQTNVDSLGMSERTLTAVRQMSEKPGLMIVSGPRGSGVTSTLYSLLKLHDAFTRQLVTLEARPAMDMENITQNVYGQDESAVAGELASALRRDADVLMIDNCPDQQTAGMVLEAAKTKPILLGMRASDTFVALAKWVKTCGEPSAAVANVKAVLCQVLIRKLCPSCREQYRPDPQMLAKANLSGQQIAHFYRPPSRQVTDDKGNPIICQTCQGSGYFGRTAVFELLEVTDEIRQLVAGGAQLAQIKAAARKNKMLYLQEQALGKVISGVTSIQEIIRVSKES
jgi:type II secretory ATPase GspE/PulE/Tfp pilus assembly ATPase PilB-like protein